MFHVPLATLEAGLDRIREAPRDVGTLARIVRRPTVGEREVVETGFLDVAEGLCGDNWKARGSNRTEDGSAHPEMQLNVMSARAIALIADDDARWALAGDQLYLDMDLSEDNLPPGTRLSIGEAVIEVTPVPHTGCKKFRERFGVDAVRFVNSPEGKRLRLRGLNAKVVQAGAIETGATVRKV